MQNEYRGKVAVPMAGVLVEWTYKAVYGTQVHVIEAHTKTDEGSYTFIGVMPLPVRVAIQEAIIADVREQEIKRMQGGGDV
jgi:uncharacterized SAM-dependent methyltransferase